MLNKGLHIKNMRFWLAVEPLFQEAQHLCGFLNDPRCHHLEGDHKCHDDIRHEMLAGNSRSPHSDACTNVKNHRNGKQQRPPFRGNLLGINFTQYSPLETNSVL